MQVPWLSLLQDGLLKMVSISGVCTASPLSMWSHFRFTWWELLPSFITPLTSLCYHQHFSSAEKSTNQHSQNLCYVTLLNEWNNVDMEHLDDPPQKISLQLCLCINTLLTRMQDDSNLRTLTFICPCIASISLWDGT